jgi:hypothetical protein
MGFISKYRIYCITENSWSIGYSATAPTECYTNADHIINENSIQRLDNNNAPLEYILLEDNRLIGTNGGSITKNVWTIRSLNTISKNSDFLIGLENNEFTLQTGNYDITAKFASSKVNKTQIRLCNVTNDSIELIGLSDEASANNSLTTLYGIVSILENTTFRIEQICSKTQNNVGVGSANGFGIEKYTSIIIKNII